MVTTVMSPPWKVWPLLATNAPMPGINAGLPSTNCGAFNTTMGWFSFAMMAVSLFKFLET